ncbi:hypothetical protein PHISP_01248 [Aspergillus sp. HF37]|nr:hypothetical protein PHISP_01248 [Aspergillus sp. HF37]
MSTGMRRSKAMPTDGPTAKFLYAIIKQLDLKSIDWNAVAASLEISNGHAARMRYSRFRQQMEGTTSTPRGSRPKKNAGKCDKGGSNPKTGLKQDPGLSPPALKWENRVVKQEHGMPLKQENGLFPPQNPMLKHEPYSQDVPNLADIPLAQPMMPAHSLPSSTVPYPQMPLAPFPVSSHAGFERRDPHHVWAPVKMEQEGSGLGDVLVKVERPESR